MKDRIGNPLAVGDKVVVSLPEPLLFGYIAEVKEPSHLVRVSKPGHILVTIVVALPAPPEADDTILQIAKVYDPAKPSEAVLSTVEPPKPN